MIDSSYHPYSHNFEEKLFQDTNSKINGENSTKYISMKNHLFGFCLFS